MKGVKITESITARDSESIALFLKDINKYTVPTQEEEVELAKKIRNGDKNALDELVSRNLRFVVSVAKQSQGYGIPLCDLINEGACGLIHAANNFDETRGFKFCSYAVFWIRQNIMRAITEQANMVRVPNNQQNMKSKINKINARFEAEFNREPTSEEVAEIAGLDIEKVLTLEKVGLQVSSLDAPICVDDSSATIADFISSPDPQTDDILDKESLHADLLSCLSQLSSRDQEVIRLSFGLDGREPIDFDTIGEMLGISHERVRQIRERAILKMRKEPKFSNILRKYRA